MMCAAIDLGVLVLTLLKIGWFGLVQNQKIMCVVSVIHMIMVSLSEVGVQRSYIVYSTAQVSQFFPCWSANSDICRFANNRVTASVKYQTAVKTIKLL